MDLSNLEQRLQHIESRLTTIENAIKIPAQPTATSPWLTTPAPQPPPQSKTSWTNSGNWLGIIAVICFVFAAGFIIKLSIDSGWLTPRRQVVLAFLFGFSLIGAGFVLLNKDREYASLLPGTGIIILYLTTFAAHRYYFLISFEMAIAITSMVTALCIWLYLKIRADVYSVTAAIGSYLAPVILDFQTAATFSLYYFILCSVAFATISVWIKSRVLTMIAAYLAILISAYIGFSLAQDLLMIVILALHFCIFSLGVYIYTQKTHQYLTKVEAWSFFPVLMVFYAMEYYFINRLQPGLAPWISLAFTGFLIGLYVWIKNRFADRALDSQAMIIAYATLVGFHSIYLELLPLDFRPWLFVAIILGYTFIPLQSYKKQSREVLYIPILALYIILGIEYINMISHLVQDYRFYWLIVSLASLGSLWTLLIVQRDLFSQKDENKYLLLSAAHLLAITSFYQLTTAYGSLAVSASWLLYAIFVITFAFVRKDKIMAKSALFVLAFAGGKALLYDVSSAPTIIRILCLLLTGGVLYGSGFLIRKIAEWQK